MSTIIDHFNRLRQKPTTMMATTELQSSLQMIQIWTCLNSQHSLWKDFFNIWPYLFWDYNFWDYLFSKKHMGLSFFFKSQMGLFILENTNGIIFFWKYKCGIIVWSKKHMGLYFFLKSQMGLFFSETTNGIIFFF